MPLTTRAFALVDRRNNQIVVDFDYVQGRHVPVPMIFYDREMALWYLKNNADDIDGIAAHCEVVEITINEVIRQMKLCTDEVSESFRIN